MICIPRHVHHSRPPFERNEIKLDQQSCKDIVVVNYANARIFSLETSISAWTVTFCLVIVYFAKDFIPISIGLIGLICPGEVISGRIQNAPISENSLEKLHADCAENNQSENEKDEDVEHGGERI